jgi:hypothetical protein
VRLLLDTCVLSEYAKSQANRQVIDWLDSQDETNLFISSISLAEIKKGMFKIKSSQPQRYQQLARWLDCLEQQFLGRTLAVDANVLATWAEINGLSEAQGKKLAVIDSLIAATAITHQASIVTRNTKDFQFIRVPVINPWPTP